MHTKHEDISHAESHFNDDKTNHLPTKEVAQRVSADLLASSVQIAYHCLDRSIVEYQVNFNDTTGVVIKAGPRDNRYIAKICCRRNHARI